MNEKVIEIPFSGFIVLILMVLLLLYRAFNWLKLIVFTMPLGVSVILIYSAYNSSYQSIFHLIAFSILMYVLAGFLGYLKLKNDK
jgi:hypothetical protein